MKWSTSALTCSLAVLTAASPLSSRSDGDVVASNITSLAQNESIGLSSLTSTSSLEAPLNLTTANATVFDNSTVSIVPDDWQWDVAISQVVATYQNTVRQDVASYKGFRVRFRTLVRAELYPIATPSHVGISSAWFLASYHLATGIKDGLVRVDFFTSPNGGTALSRIEADFDSEDHTPIFWPVAVRQQTALALVRTRARVLPLEHVFLEVLPRPPHLRTRPELCWTYFFKPRPDTPHLRNIAHVFMNGDVVFEVIPNPGTTL